MIALAFLLSFSLTDTAGKVHAQAELAGRRATVMVFTTTDCPVTNSYVPELNRLSEEYGPRGVAFYAVHSDPSQKAATVRQFAREFHLKMPVLLDPDLTLARRLGASTMPEAAVLDAEGRLVYRGRIDDRVIDFGKKRLEPRSRDLRGALDSVLAGREVDVARTRATGCAIPFALASAPKAVTFNRDIAPILFENCAACHRPGEVAPFPLLTYQDAKKRAAQIATVTRSRYMPPWKAEGHGVFLDERRLTDAQIATIERWAKSGAPEGDARDLPPAPRFASGWQAGEPDRVAAMPEPFSVRAEGRDQFQCFVVPLGLEEDAYIGTVEFRPGNPRVVHHALFFLDTMGRGRKNDAATPEPGYPCLGGPGFLPTGALGGWAPGASPQRVPEGTARTVAKGSDLIVQIHYHPSGKPEQDRSQLGLHFAPKPRLGLSTAVIGTRHIDIAPGEAAYTVKAGLDLPADVLAVGITPHAHYLCKEMKVTAKLPSGELKPLLHIPDWDFNWQGQYRYGEPVALPQGTRVEIEYTYDNSAANPRNPSNPPVRVTYGEQTTNEMAFAFLQVQLDKPEDVPGFLRAMFFNLVKERVFEKRPAEPKP